MRTLATLSLSASALATGLVACVAPVGEAEEPNEELEAQIEEAVQDLKDCDYDKAKADLLSQKARSGAGARSQKRCYRFVKQHLRNAGFTLPSILGEFEYGESAADFIKFANDKPAMLDQIGLVPVSVPDGEKVPQGVIMVWPRGTCGYSKKHGHIEVVCSEDGTQACSDYRGRNKKSAACVPTLYAPKGTCLQADSCADKEDGYYCSSINAGAAFGCRNKAVVGSTYCPTAGQKCGEGGTRANISGGAMHCQ